MGEAVCILFDCSLGWVGKEEFFHHTLFAVSVFMRAFLTMHQQNRLVVIGCNSSKSDIVYYEPESEVARKNPSDVSSEAMDALAKFTSKQGTSDLEDFSTKMSSALTFALCFLNKLKNTKRRIVTVSIAPDSPKQYLSVMNALFSAQKANIMIDSLVLSKSSQYLQQAAKLTKGVYVESNSKTNITSVLLGHFTADAQTRKYLVMEKAKLAESKAACFCHKKPVEVGFVCSVCLSIFCSFVPICSTCSSKFSFPKLPSSEDK